MITAYKLLRVRKDGSLGPLFIGRYIVIPVGKWLKAKAIPTKGFALRVGWHACSAPHAPHLTKKDRIWCVVSLKSVRRYLRPKSQGGMWYVAMWMRVDGFYRGVG